jgi:predicted 3-demethylubiquinone-9 3-methyltransferase (glyoxalase superfamily)
MEQKITPFLWYDKDAGKIAEFYASVFKGSKIKSSTKIPGTPSGTVEIVGVELFGQDFTLMSAGPLFKFNPSVSFLVACDTKEEVDALWEKLFKGGKARMELGSYPFSGRYGWTDDKYGLSWQIMLTDMHKTSQKITPTFMFVGKNCGKAEEAMNLYVSVFKGKIGGMMRYGKGQEPDKDGTIIHADFALSGQAFAAMDSAREHKFTFNEAISFVVHCKDQKEIDYYWRKLSSVPESEQCGWCKDKFGLSWQVYPDELAKMLQDKDSGKVARVTQAFMQMKKFDIAALEKAYKG